MNNLEKLCSVLTFVMLIAAVTSVTFTDYRLLNHDESRNTGATPRCETTGLICDGCKDVYFCDSQLRPSKTQTCNSTQNCENGRCTNTPTFQCSPGGALGFLCQMEGVFPDPGDCFKYHICVANTDYDNTDIKSADLRHCKNLYSYNARTTYCDKKMTSAVCPSYAVPLCTKPSQTGALKDNPSIYYLCQVVEDAISPEENQIRADSEPEVVVLYPYLRICDHGKIYDSLTYSCK